MIRYIDWYLYLQQESYSITNKSRGETSMSKS